LWILSLVVSLVLNALVFLAIAVVSPPQAGGSTATVVPQEQVAMIELVMPQVTEPVAAVREQPREAAAEPEPEPVPATDPVPAAPVAAVPVLKPSFSQTSEEQTSSEAPVKAMFIGERNTRATSDQTPDPTAAPLPSQQGIAANNRVETLDRQSPAEPKPADPAPAPAGPPAVTVESLPPGPAVTVEPAVTIESEPSMEGPNPVAVPVPRPRPTPVPAPEPPPVVEPPQPQSQPPRPAPQTPAPSAGKTQISGSISRDGKSAVDVVDTPLGRYQAVVNKLVGEEFMRNCERYQNLITPGFMTVHFVIGQDGKLGKDLAVTEEVDCTIQQKGFTLQAIRGAKFPPLPPELRKKLGRDPLELTITFNF